MITMAEAQRQHRKRPDSSTTLDSKALTGDERPIPTGPEKGPTVAELKEEHKEIIAEKRTRKPYTKRRKETDIDTEKRDNFVQGLALFSKMSLELICARLPNPLPPTPIEIKGWNDSISALGEKYFPIIANWDAELSLLLVSIVIFTPRLKGKEDAKTSGDDSGKDGHREDSPHKTDH